MAAAIKAVSDSGVPCYFIHGNRDFLLGKRFARESGMTLLPEEKVLELYGRRVLIMHGDTPPCETLPAPSARNITSNGCWSFSQATCIWQAS